MMRSSRYVRAHHKVNVQLKNCLKHWHGNYSNYVHACVWEWVCFCKKWMVFVNDL